jgi:hypothetical protein
VYFFGIRYCTGTTAIKPPVQKENTMYDLYKSIALLAIDVSLNGEDEYSNLILDKYKGQNALEKIRGILTNMHMNDHQLLLKHIQMCLAHRKVKS